MNDSINLVGAQETGNVRRHKRVFVLRVISLVFLSFVAVVSIILFVLNIRVSTSSIKNEQAFVTRNISLQKDKFAKLNLLNDRLKGIRQVLKDRKNYTATVNSILDQVPSGASASTLSINKDGITLTVASGSLLSINKFLNNVIDLSIQKRLIKDMVIESLSIDTKTGIYSLSIKAKTI